MTGEKKVKKTTKPRAREDRSRTTRAQRNNGVAKKKTRTQKKGIELNDSRGI